MTHQQCKLHVALKSYPHFYLLLYLCMLTSPGNSQLASFHPTECTRHRAYVSPNSIDGCVGLFTQPSENFELLLTMRLEDQTKTDLLRTASLMQLGLKILPNSAGNDSNSSGTTSPLQQTNTQARSMDAPSVHTEDFPTIPNGAAIDSGSHIDSRAAWVNGREKAEELMAIALKWMASVHHFTALTFRGPNQQVVSLISKVQTLLNGESKPSVILPRFFSGNEL